MLSNAYISSEASVKLPVLTKLSTTGLMTFIGIAKPIPSAEVIFIVFIPITAPLIFTSGPPLFPGLIVASVCIKSDT